MMGSIDHPHTRGTQSIAFTFDLMKAIEAMGYLIERLGGIEKLKLVLLLYVADRRHFLRHGYPITNDRMMATHWGPVPAHCLSAINGQFFPEPDALFEYLHVDDNKVMILSRSGSSHLDESERQILDTVIFSYGAKDRDTLIASARDYPEYKEVYTEGAINPIPYELILKHSGEDRHFRLGRPVISEAMRMRMACPFPDSDADL